MVKPIVKNNLQQILQQKGKNQNWLSRKTGDNRHYVSKLCNQKIVDPRLSTCMKYAKALECTVEEIWPNN